MNKNLSKTAAAMLARMRQSPEAGFLPVSQQEEKDALKLTQLGLTVRSGSRESDYFGLPHPVYSLTEAGRRASRPVIRVSTRAQLQDIARALGTRRDWHEPDEQEVTAAVHGTHLDNAGFWGHLKDGTLDTYGNGLQELRVELLQDGEPVAEVSLATLLAFATGWEG